MTAVSIFDSMQFGIFWIRQDHISLLQLNVLCPNDILQFRLMCPKVKNHFVFPPISYLSGSVQHSGWKIRVNMWWAVHMSCHPTMTKGPFLFYGSKGTGWVGSEKWHFLLTFSTIYADVGWLGGSEKALKCADVI